MPAQTGAPQPRDAWVSPELTIIDARATEASGTAVAPDGSFCMNDGDDPCS
jgi:hypothetical protein